MIMSWRMRWAGHVHMERRGTPIGSWWEGQKEPLKRARLCGRIILKCIRKRENEVVWTELIWLGVGNNGELL
jgi:hypothetical protein